MAAQFSSKSTIRLPRVIIALALVVCVAGAASFAESGSLVTVIIPGSVVVGMGLYFNGAQRYDVLGDKIRIVGILGERNLSFTRIYGFDDSPPTSFGARLQSLITGARLLSAVKVQTGASLFSGSGYLWVENREAFLQAARDALKAQPSTAT